MSTKPLSYGDARRLYDTLTNRLNGKVQVRIQTQMAVYAIEKRRWGLVPFFRVLKLSLLELAKLQGTNPPDTLSGTLYTIPHWLMLRPITPVARRVSLEKDLADSEYEIHDRNLESDEGPVAQMQRLHQQILTSSDARLLLDELAAASAS